MHCYRVTTSIYVKCEKPGLILFWGRTAFKKLPRDSVLDDIYERPLQKSTFPLRKKNLISEYCIP